MKEDYSMYDLDYEPGANEEIIQRLINSVGRKLPNEYVDFLRFSNGAFGTYLYVYPIDEVLSYLTTEWIKEDIPGLLVIGSDGGGEAYGYNLNFQSPEIVMVPFIGGRWENAVVVATKFHSFLEIASKPGMDKYLL